MAVEALGRRDLPQLSDVAAAPERMVWFGRLAVRAILRRYDVHTHGLDKIPSSGPVILASNHVGYLDGPLLVATAPRNVHAMVKESMFHGAMGFGLRLVGQICVDRYRTDMRAVKTTLRVLERGGVVAIYPEGARGRGDVSYTKGGAAYLALVTGAPVVPVACLGTREDGAPHDSRPRPGTRIDLVVGDGVCYDAIPWPRTKQRVAAVRDDLQQLLAGHVQQACLLTGQHLPAPESMPDNPPEPR